MSRLSPFQGVPEVSETEGTLLLAIPAGGPAPPGTPVRLPEGEFRPKAELHVTVIGREPGARLQRAGIAMDTVRRHANRIIWTVHPRNAFWLIEAPPKPGYADKRRTIIQRVDVPGLEAFLDALAESCGIRLPTPPAHMTWFTQNWSRGIGLDTEEEFRERRVRRLSGVIQGLQVGGIGIQLMVC